MFITPYLTPLDWVYQEAEAVSSRDALANPRSCVDSIWGWPVEERPFIMKRFDFRSFLLYSKCELLTMNVLSHYLDMAFIRARVAELADAQDLGSCG